MTQNISNLKMISMLTW